MTHMTDAELLEQMAANPTFGRRKEPKACDGCGHVRSVLVYFVTVHGKERDHRWEPHCAACQAERRARWYRAEAARFDAKAADLRAAQAKSVQRRALGRKR